MNIQKRFMILTSIISILAFLNVVRVSLASWYPADGQGGP